MNMITLQNVSDNLYFNTSTLKMSTAKNCRNVYTTHFRIGFRKYCEPTPYALDFRLNNTIIKFAPNFAYIYTVVYNIRTVYPCRRNSRHADRYLGSRATEQMWSMHSLPLGLRDCLFGGLLLYNDFVYYEGRSTCCLRGCIYITRISYCYKRITDFLIYCSVNH